MKLSDKPLLMTATLLDNFAWYEKCPSSWKERAFKALQETLFRAPFRPTPEIQRGMDFEKKINGLVSVDKDVFVRLMNNKHPAKNIGAFWDVCHGGEQQKKLSLTLEHEGQEYFLFGKADYWFPSKVVDVKTTANYTGAKKYTEKAQHLMYAVMSKIPSFEYVVGVFDDDAGICYNVERIPLEIDVDEAEKELRRRITNAVGAIAQDQELLRAYTTIFTK